MRRLRGFATSCFWRNLLGKGVEKGVEKNKRGKIIKIIPLWLVGMTGFERRSRSGDTAKNKNQFIPATIFYRIPTIATVSRHEQGE